MFCSVVAQKQIMLSGCKLNDRVGITFCARTVQSIFAWNFNSLVGLASGSHDTWQCDSAAECGPFMSPDKCLYYYMTIILSDVLCQDL
jgi:hypothetical protein